MKAKNESSNGGDGANFDVDFYEMAFSLLIIFATYKHTHSTWTREKKMQKRKTERRRRKRAK